MQPTGCFQQHVREIRNGLWDKEWGIFWNNRKWRRSVYFEPIKNCADRFRCGGFQMARIVEAVSWAKTWTDSRGTGFLYTSILKEHTRTHVGGQCTEEANGRQISSTAAKEKVSCWLRKRVSECSLLYVSMLDGERETPSSAMGRCWRKRRASIKGGGGGGNWRETTSKRWRPEGGGFGLVKSYRRVPLKCAK